MSNILLAEDDRFLADGLSRRLKLSGYRVDQVHNGVDAETAARTGPYDLLILDIGLPRKDGREVLSGLRDRGINIPILILTALDSSSDRVRGLDLGANDYLCKPFDMDELEARIRALLRKSNWDNQSKITVGALQFDTQTQRASVNNEPLELSPREFRVLKLMLQRLGRVVLKNQFFEELADEDIDITSNALDIVIHRLRKKLENSGCEIRTIRGLGFIIEKDV